MVYCITGTKVGCLSGIGLLAYGVIEYGVAGYGVNEYGVVAYGVVGCGVVGHGVIEYEACICCAVSFTDNKVLLNESNDSCCIRFAGEMELLLKLAFAGVDIALGSK